jgi:lipopolysaccharide export system permease protein
LQRFHFLLGHYVIPQANKTLNDFRWKYIDNSSVITERNIHRQIEPGVYIYMQNFNASNVGIRFTLERFEGAKLVEKLTADNIRWDEETNKWIINNYWKRIIYDDHEEFEKVTGLTQP